MNTTIENRSAAAADNREYRFSDHRVVCKLSAEATGGMFSLFDVDVDPDAGTPPHIHRKEDETFFIMEGRFALMMEDKTVEAGPGDCVFAPKDRLHAWRNVGGTPGRMLVLTTPGGFEHFFADMEAFMSAAPEMNAATMEELLAISARHGVEMIAPVK